MQSGPSGNRVSLVTCPHCGQQSEVQPDETLHLNKCRHCQRQHVASLATQRASSNLEDTSVGSQPALPPEVTTYLGTIGRYIITKALGEGAFGIVYKAWDPNLHRWVAIKVPAFRQRQGQSVELFLNEARAAARLRHPRIVSIYDADTQDGRPYLVCEFVDGMTLKSVLETSKTLPPRKTMRIIYELATALQVAHRQGVVHRDIKPANIMIDSEGRPRLMDFGLARLSSDAYEANQSGIIGTVAYMSPEQARGEHGIVASASDQYNLGVVMFECLAGSRPRSGSMAELLPQISRTPAPRLKDVKPNIPANLDRICGRMLAERIEDRYLDLSSVAAELSELLRAKPMPEPTPAPTRSYGRYVIAVGFGLFLFLAAGLSLFLFRSERPGRPDDGVTKISPPPTLPEAAPPPKVADTTDSETPPPAAPIDDKPTEVAIAGTLIQPPDDPPADAFAATQPPASEPLMAEDFEPSYPTQYPELDQFRAQNTLQTIVKEALVWQLLEHSVGQKLPPELESVTKKLRKIDSEIFKTVMDVAGIQQVDPQVSFALACVRQRATMPSKEAKLLVSHEALWTQAKDNQQILFTPAYRSLISDFLRSNGGAAQEQAFDLMLELATRLNQPAVWPDRAERLRTARWLGTIHGFYLVPAKAAEAAKPSNRQKFFQKQQSVLEAVLPENLRVPFVDAAQETQRQIISELKEFDSPLSTEIVAAIEQQAADSDLKADEKRKLDSQKAGLGEQQKLIEEEFVALSEELVNQIRFREERLNAIAVDIQKETPAFFQAQQRYSKALSDMQLLNETAAMGTPVDPGQQMFAENACSRAREDLVQVSAKVDALRRSAQQYQVEINGIRAQWQQLVQRANFANQKVVQQSRKIENDLKKLDQSVRKSKSIGNKSKEGGSKAKIQDLLRIDHWIDWSQDDAEKWLIHSLLAKPRVATAVAPLNP
jgi:serine/threonine protein kinase